MKKRPPIQMSPDQQRFFDENAAALAEAAKEQRELRAKRRKSGVPDRVFLPDHKGSNIIICRRK